MIIVSDPIGPLDYAERAVDAVDNLVVTKNWNKFHIFQSNLTKDQIFNLAKLPFVKRMENNSF